jgi:hypothetical protein
VPDTILPTDSAGQIATDNNTSGIQNPAQPASVLTADGRINPSNIETGTNAPVVTLTDSQGTPASPPVVPAANVNQDLTANTTDVAAPTTNPGVGSGADAVSPTKNATVQTIDNIFGSAAAIVPQPNVLDQYSTYTYQASFYLMKPEAFAAMVKNKKKNLAGAQLLFQSGGASVTGRNQYFSNDYYIDRIDLKSSIAGKGTNMAHNVNEIKMSVVEPNGITLIENLDKAVQDYLGNTGNPPKKKNFQAQLYLLVIKFYGYNDSGKLVQAGQDSAAGTTNTTPQTAFVEKYYPMALNKINFKIANKLVEYEFLGTGVQYQINTGQLRAVVPYNIELSSSTLQDAFNGAAEVGTTASTTVVNTGTAVVTTTVTTRDQTVDANGSSNPPPAPPKADAAPTTKLTVRKGIVAAMNQFQQDKVSAGEITYPDVYSVEFVTDAVAQARIKRAGQTDKQDPMPSGGTAKQQLDPDTQSKDNTTRTLSITAGQPMVQVLDQLLKNSTYIEDQQLYKILEKTGEQVPNGASAKNLAWYKISMQATPRNFDPLRNAYAYDIKYIVHPYKINDMISNYFTTPKYSGVHKQYNYWFTGLNTQILSYEQTYNNLYTQVLSGGPPNKNAAAQSEVQTVTATRSAQSSQGAQGRTNEPAANAADYLFSPGDNNECVMSIVGDPAWLQQGEATFGVDSKNFNFGGFLTDGTINYDSQQILFEVLFNTPSDYNLNTGLMDPNVPASTSATNTTVATGQPGANRKSFIFLAKEVMSEFVKGKFTQTLKGVKINYFSDQAQKSSTARPATSAVANPTTGNDTRTLNTADGPAGQNYIPTTQPQFALVDNNGYALPPIAGSQNATSADGTIAQPTTNTLSAQAPVTPLPASPPSPPTSTGDIQSFTDYAAARAGTGGVQSTAQQQQIAAVAAAENGSGSTNLAPAPAILPLKSPAETYDQYQAKLENSSSQQVNTTPPQPMNKSDQ